MKSLPDISIVIVNFNGIDDTRQLLGTIHAHLDMSRVEVIVVDNGSASNEASPLSVDFLNDRFIRSEENLGFAGGNNLGIKVSSGRYVLLLNNDTLLVDDSLYGMVGFMDEHPDIGGVSPRLFFLNPPGVLQYAGLTDLSPVTLRNEGLGYGHPDGPQFMTALKTFFLHGAAMMVRREVIDKIGLMSEDYFLYYEEYDWCQDIRDAGYELWYYPFAKVIHKESRSTGKISNSKQYYLTRNRLIYASKHRRGLVRLMAILYQLFVADAAAIIKALASRKMDLVKTIFEGINDFLKHRVGKWRLA
jgi:hypothetical protein